MADTKTPDTKNSDSKMNQGQGATNERLRSESNQADNQTMRHEQAKGAVSGDRAEKSAIGGGQSDGQSGSQTGEPGRARDELGQDRNDSDKSRNEADKARSEFDKSRSAPTGQQR
jgi:hypothetical protein